jgi:hypothetical protein
MRPVSLLHSGRSERNSAAQLAARRVTTAGALGPVDAFGVEALEAACRRPAWAATNRTFRAFPRSPLSVKGEGMRSYDWPLLDGAGCRISYVRRTLAKISQASSDLATRLRVM